MPTLNIVLIEPEIPQNTGISAAPARPPVPVCTWWDLWAFGWTIKK